MYLEALGHSVITARTKSGALAAIPSADCDMFICDISLPDGNGWDLLKDARFSRPVYPLRLAASHQE
jgi:DNA-binding response OmpR family regulator